MIDNNKKPSIILVLGMHRSGTSLVAQMVARWGVNMGNDLMEANEFNQDGYWEYNPLVNLHDKMLAYTRNMWYAPPRYNNVKHLLEVFGNEAHELVNKMDVENITWCWKDPRIALFLPFWQKILKERKLLYVISYRNPLTVADSLKMRDNIPTITATALWEVHYLKIFEALKSSDICFFAEYEKLIDKSEELTKQLFDFLNTQLHEKKGSDILQQMGSAIKPGLKHSLPIQNISIDKQQNDLYTLLQQERIPLKDIEYLHTRISFDLEITDLYHKGNYYKEENLLLQLFYKHKEKSYGEEHSVRKKYEPNAQQVVFELDELNNIEFLRFDPLNDWLQCICGELDLYYNNKHVATVKAVSHNATKVFADSLFFASRDPQVYFKTDHLENEYFNKAIIRFKYLKVGTQCKTYFAENPALFFDDLFPEKENDNHNEHSIVALYRQVSDKIQGFESRISQNEKLLKKKEETLLDIYEQNSQLTSDLKNANKQIDNLKYELTNKQQELQKVTSREIKQLKTIKKYEKQYLELSKKLQDKEQQIKTERIHFQNEIKNTNETLQRHMDNERTKLVRQYRRRLPLRLAGNLLRFIKHPLQYYRMRRDTIIIRRSGMFDDAWYLQQYPDLHLTTVDMLQHYMLYGAAEGRNPNPMFNTAYYLKEYPDVKKAGCNPLLHFVRYGAIEGRSTQPHGVKENSGTDPKNKTDNLPSKSEVQMSKVHIESEYDILKNSPIDWSDFFPFNNIVCDFNDPIAYYIENWKSQNLKINNFFETQFYLDNYPDIAIAGINPLVHFVKHGIHENRIAFFNDEDFISDGSIKYDPQKLTYVIACHESSATGAPLVGLNLGIELNRLYNVIFVILKSDSLHESFRDACTCMVSNLLYAPIHLMKKVLRKINNQYSIDAVICNSIGTATFLDATSQMKFPTILLLHEFSSYTKPAGLVANSIISADRVIVPSSIIEKSALDEIIQVYKKRAIPNNFTIAPQGKLPIMPEVYGDAFSISELNQILNIKSKSTKVVIGAGYVQIRKGIDLFISVAEKIKQQYTGDIRFVWIGDGFEPDSDFNYSMWLKIQLDSSEVKDDFFFLGHQKNLDNILKITDCFLLTSRLDPFPNVVIDALEADVYVACFESTTGSAEFMLEYNVVGDVIPYLDVHTMAEKVSNYLSLEQDEKMKYKGINSAIVKEQLSFGNYISIIESEISKAKQNVQKRIEIENRINNPQSFNKHYFRYLIDTNDAVDFYIKSTLKGIHLADPIPGFSGTSWMDTNNSKDQFMVPIFEALEKGEKPITHDCLILTGVEKSPNFKIAVHIHLFYPDLAEEFASYLSNITQKFDLFISICDENYTEEVKQYFKQKNIHNLKIIVVENAGRDIAPFFIDFKEHILSGHYDIIGHFHSKKSNEFTLELGTCWRHYLLDNLMGEKAKLNQLFDQFNNEKIGLIFAEDSYSVDISKNLECANKLCEVANLSTIKNAYIFPLGTMFWARPEALKPFFDLDFSNFIQLEPLPEDGTFLHAIERLIPHCVEACGFKYKTVYTEGTKW